jgi:hypothetical protein
MQAGAKYQSSHPMNVIIFMPKARCLAGMAATQTERENEGPPWPGTVAERFFSFHVGISTALRTFFSSFCTTTNSYRALSRATTAVRKQTHAQEHRLEVSSLTPKDKDKVCISRMDKIHANGSCHEHHVGTPNVSTPFFDTWPSHHDHQPRPPKQPY